MNIINDYIAGIVQWGTEGIIGHNLDFGLSEDQVKKVITAGIALGAITTTGFAIANMVNIHGINHPVVEGGNDEQNFQEIMAVLDQNQNQ